MIKNIKLFINDNDKSLKVARLVEDTFLKKGFNIVEADFDLGIAIGGDGAFLRMVKNTNFDSIPYYVGVNSGTLGFMQEVKIDEIDNLVKEIEEEKFKVDEIGIQETKIIHGNNLSEFYSLNEILIRDKDLRVLKVAVNIDGDLLEYYTGDALLIATSHGSTAHNLSYGGSIVYNTFSSLQITPIGPINSKSYRSLPNSIIIPSQKEIEITGNGYKKDLMITIDGVRNIYNDVENINTSIKDKKIKALRFSHYSFSHKINEKLLSD